MAISYLRNSVAAAAVAADAGRQRDHADSHFASATNYFGSAADDTTRNAADRTARASVTTFVHDTVTSPRPNSAGGRASGTSTRIAARRGGGYGGRLGGLTGCVDEYAGFLSTVHDTASTQNHSKKCRAHFDLFLGWAKVTQLSVFAG